MMVSMSDVTFIGEDLFRPESVLTTARGEIFCSDHRTGVMQLGKAKRALNGVPEGFLPNGIALLKNREVLVANLGAGGGVWRIDHDANLHPWLMEADGEPLTITNFVGIDSMNRTWVSMSTRRSPRELSFRKGVGDGFIAMVDESGARIMADGIGFTNECRVDPSGKWVYVNETFDRKLSRFPLDRNRLGQKEVVVEFDDGNFPDGLSFDEEGGVWVACVVSNRVLRVTQSGAVEVVLDDSDRAIIEAAENKYRQNELGRADVDSGSRRILGNVSSIAFGGADRRQVILGTLGNNRLATFRSSIAGAAPPHWHF
ncbi:SMP-30/gluconolactonase/LRE family protein [Paraburkholderia azotifigens]|uniref:SMP-30/gluconolactonase/LRE family protein n=1 Tax=Paraburkholderia azotifigens TaxID=2057004 RepID=A0ABU9RFA2_9BURK